MVQSYAAKHKKRMANHTYFYAALRDLKEKPTYKEMFPDWQSELKKGKQRVE